MFPLLGPGSFGSGPSACRLREAIGRTARSRASLALLGRRTARDDAAACQDEPIAAPFLNSQDAPCPRDKISGRYLLRTRATVNHRDAVPWILDAIVSEQRPRVVGFGCFIRGGTVRPCHGTVRWFDVRKGYGFLKPDDDGVDVLSRDSQFGQRIRGPLAVEICDGVVDGVVERDGVGEGLVGEVMGLEVAPDRLDVIEFGRVFRQPLDSEPVCASRQRGKRAFAGVDRTIVLDQHDRLGLSPGLRSIETVELLEMDDEIAAPLGRVR